MIESANFQKSGIFFLLILLFLLIISLASLNTTNAATPLYVNGTSGNDSWDGTSPVPVDEKIGPLLTINTAITKVDDGGTINVAEGNYAENLIISKNLNLIGTGQNLTYIDGKDLGSVITISSGVNVQIINLTICNGASSDDGGGIYNDGTIIINNSNIKQNVATGNGGAIYNSGRVEIYNCNLEENQAGNVGGGIFNTASATLNIENSTLYGNSATDTGSWGGAICNDGTVTINNSQFIENIAGQHGGAISNSYGVLTVTQSNFYLNAAISGAILNYYGTVNAHYNRIVGNTGPEFYNAAGTFNAEYNWWGQNTGPGASQTSGAVTATPWLYMNFIATPSLILYGATSQLDASFNNAYDGTNITPLDPVHGHLDDSCVVTFTTDYGSVGSNSTMKNTIDGVASAIFAADEGIGTANITAQFNNQILNTTVQITDILYVNGNYGNDTWNGLSPTHLNGTTTGPMKTIQNAVNAIQIAATVNVSSGTYNEYLTINKNINLIGAGQDLTFIDGNHLGRVITVSPSKNVNITGISIVNGSATYGGGIYNEGILVISNCNLTGNVANYGGAILNRQGTLTITDSTLTVNNVNYSGGAIYITEGTVTLLNTTLISNTAGYIYNNNGCGGAIYNQNGTLTVNSSNFTNNNAGHNEMGYDYAVYGYGGAIYNKYGTTNINTTILFSNTAYQGGAIYSESALNLINSTITGNTATLYGNDGVGGGICSNGPTNITCSNITYNTASNFCGGLYTTGYTNINYSNITHNTADSVGGIYVGTSGNMHIIYSNINNNSVADGFGGIDNTGYISIIYSNINNNSARGCGGISSTGTMDISYSNINNNRASNGEAGGICAGGPTNISYVNIINNTATTDGGGIYVDGFTANIYITNCTVINNSATNGGGICIISDPSSFYVYINNSTLTNNTATNGGALFNYIGTIIMHFNRIASNSLNTIYSSTTYAISDAQNNWWGSNSNPSSQFAGTGTVNYFPWLYMTFTANPTFILNNTTSQLTADFNNIYNGTTVTPIDPVNGHIPDGTSVTFGTDLGNVGSKTTTKTTSNGIATATLTADEGIGFAHVSGKLDNQNLTSTIRIHDNNRYVNAAIGNDTWDGTSPTWINGTTTGPMKTITTALNAINTGGTINVASGVYTERLTIGKNLNLVGAGQDLTIIDGLHGGTVITVSSGMNVNITGVTILNGTAPYGGGIYNYGTLTLNNSKVTANYASITGGGIRNDGTMNLFNCNVTGNTAVNAAGIINFYGTMTINNTNITGNVASGNIGAIYNNVGTLIITNSTISGNSASAMGGAIHNLNGGVIVNYCRIVNNSPSNIDNSGGTVDARYNWWGSNSGPTGIVGTVTTSPWLYMTLNAYPTCILEGTTSTLNASLNNAYNGTTITPIDPATGHLPDGNPVTFTTDMGSVGSKTTVKNTSNGVATATLTADEGVGTAHVSAQLDNQVINSTVGIETLYVNGATGNDTWDGNSPIYIGGISGPIKTIQRAINTITIGGTINIASGTYSEHLTINKNLNLIGAGQDLTVINGFNMGTVVRINSPYNVNITGVTIQNGSEAIGCGIYNSGFLTLNNCKLTGNNAGIGDGGAIYNNGGPLVIINSTITGNTATAGAGIYNMGGYVTITNSTLTNNTASSTAGGIFNGGSGYVTVQYCQILNNTSSNIDNSGGTVDARYNWWGSNSGPTGIVGTVTTSPWLYMTLTTNPTLILNGSTSTLNASLNNAYNGTTITPIDPATGHLPDGCPVTFTTDLGSVGSKTTTKNTINGVATATLTADEGVGTAHISAQLDNQVINSTVGIETLYVNGATGNDTWDGTSPTWINGTTTGPMKTITTALNAINSGGTINVAIGIYTERFTIGKNLNLVGAGQDLTFIDGTHGGIVITVSSGKTVNITGVTILNGTSTYGGGIYNYGTLTLNNSKITANYALTSGGGIRNDGTMNIFNCNITGNSGLNAGGAVNAGTMIINNTNITGNSASSNMGGVYNNAGTLTITNSTITGNTASTGGAIHSSGGTVIVHYCRIVNNSPYNIYSMSGTIDARNNWWGSNSGPTGTYGSVSAENWLYMTFTANPPFILNGSTSTLTADFNNIYNGVTVTLIDPANGHLPDSTPVTFGTDLGNVGSKTTNKTTTNGIATATLTADEGIGFAHVSGNLDNQNLTSTIRIHDNNRYVNTATGNDTWDGTSPTYISGITGPMKTIQTAINAVETGGTVNVALGIYNEAITIGKNLNLLGAGQNESIIDGSGLGTIITITGTPNVNITGLTIRNSSYGGGIVTGGSVIINTSIISNNTKGGFGGGIENWGALTIINSIITGNSASLGFGGAIYNTGILNIINSTINGNTAFDGGAICNEGAGDLGDEGILNIINSTITNNSASRNGGAIYNSGTVITITNSTLTDNTASSGGAIYNAYSTSCTLLFNRIAGNSPNSIWTSRTINAEYNWWGTNSNPYSQFAGTGTVNYSPWLYMTFTASPTSILNGTTSTLTADFNNIYNGVTVTPIDPANGHLPDGSVVTFGTDLGNVGSKTTTKTTTNGIATATLTADEGIGFANVSGRLDNQNLTSTIRIHDNNRYVNTVTGNDTWDGTSPTYISGITGPMKTIQTAITAVETGGTVNVASGTYTGNLNINKALNLLGEGLVILNPVSTISGITITNAGSGSIVRGFNITVSSSPSSTGAIYLNGANYCNITGNYVSGYWAGIYVYTGSKWNNISNNTITGNQYGIRIVGSGTENNIIYGNTITQNTLNGIYLTTVPIGTIINFNRISNNAQYDLYTSGATVNAEYNWWGLNGISSSSINNLTLVDYYPLIYMTFNATPTCILEGATSELSASFNNAYDGFSVTQIDPVLGHIPDGSPVTFTTDLGNVGSKTTTKSTSNGIATATLTTDEGTGFANVSAQTDTQILSASIRIHDNNRYVNNATGNDSWDGTSPTYISGTTGPMKTIQTAINAVEDSGYVNVASGTYIEPITINKNLNLLGAGSGATILMPPSSNINALLINSGGCGSAVSGFNITGAIGVAGILLNSVNDTSIMNNALSGNTLGIALSNAGNNYISDTLFVNNGAALQIYRSNLNTVTNCTFTSNDYGLYLLEGNNNTINNSLFTVTNGNGRALYLESAQGNQIIYNTITGGVYGIESLNDLQNIYNGNDVSNTAWRDLYLTNPVQDVITGNRIHDTINGLLLLGGSENQLLGNTLFGCGSGLEVVNSFNNILNDNNITQTTFGMYIYGNTGTTISQNNVTGCGSAIELHDSSENTVGNNSLVLNTFGVYIAGGSLNTVADNVVFNTSYGGAGVHFENSSNNTIINNSFTCDVKDFRYGIYVNEGSNNTINNNTASNNHAGLELHNTNLNQVNENSLNNNTVGLFMDNSSENVFSTNFINNNGAGVEMHDSHLNIFSVLNVSSSTFGFIIFNGNNNTITNSVLNNNGAAINLQTCANSTIDNNQMNNNSYGVYVLNGDHNLVQNSEIIDIKLDGSGVFLDNTTQNTVKGNSFVNTEKLFTYGIYQTGGNNNVLESNTAIRNHAGIELHDTTGNLIVSNNLSFNTLGVFMWASSQNNLTSNVISDNGAGIEIHQSMENNLTGNNLTNNVYGLYLDQLTSSNIKNNNLTTNTVGLFSDNSNTNEIYTNNFSSNTTQAYDTGTNNYDNGVNTGNYWSDYSSSGVYPILGGSNIDHYPTTAPF